MRSKLTFDIEGATKSHYIRSITLDMESFSHEMLTVELKTPVLSYDDVKPGSKVESTISLPGEPFVREFVGYIHHIVPHQNKVLEPDQIVCIGASYVLKTCGQKVWSNMTATAVATEICTKHRLSYNILPHKRIFQQLSQAGMSDWQFLCYLAKKIGYIVYPEGSSINMVPLLNSWETGGKSAKIFSLNKTGNLISSTLFEFKANIGDSMPTNGVTPASPLTIGIDPRSNSLIGSNADTSNKKRSSKKRSIETFFESINNKVVVNNAEDGIFESQAYLDRNRFPLKAKARVSGSPALEPTFPVYLMGVGETYGGYWIVDRVKHFASRDGYECHLELLTDSLGANSSPPTNASIDLTPGTTRISSVVNTVKKNSLTILPGMEINFSDSEKWTGSQSNLRNAPESQESISDITLGRMLSYRSQNGL